MAEHPPNSRRRKVWRRTAALVAGLLLAWCVLLGALIVAEGDRAPRNSADAAVVLGAAAYGSAPSPVFEERIRHGIRLFREGKVRKIVFTGGTGAAGGEAEARVARRYALAHGVPADAILIETVSRTTQQNLVQARALLVAHDLGSALVVSDPLHMRRSLRMAHDLGIDAQGAPTPTSRYRSWQAKAPFLLREIYFYSFYLVTGR